MRPSRAARGVCVHRNRSNLKCTVKLLNELLKLICRLSLHFLRIKPLYFKQLKYFHEFIQNQILLFRPTFNNNMNK